MSAASHADHFAPTPSSLTPATEVKFSWPEALTISRALVRSAREVRRPSMLLRLADRFGNELAGQDPATTSLPSLTAWGGEWASARAAVCRLKHQGLIEGSFAVALLVNLDLATRIARMRQSEAIGEDAASRLLGTAERSQSLHARA